MIKFVDCSDQYTACKIQLSFPLIMSAYSDKIETLICSMYIYMRIVSISTPNILFPRYDYNGMNTFNFIFYNPTLQTLKSIANVVSFKYI